MTDVEVKIYTFEKKLAWTFNRWKLLEAIYQKKEKKDYLLMLQEVGKYCKYLKRRFAMIGFKKNMGENIYSIYLLMVFTKDIYLGS